MKQSWKTLSLPAVTSAEEADGVIINTRSSLHLVETEMEEPVVVGPAMTCMPQSMRLL